MPTDEPNLEGDEKVEDPRAVIRAERSRDGRSPRLHPKPKHLRMTWLLRTIIIANGRPPGKLL
jgi:hypothetical protein